MVEHTQDPEVSDDGLSKMRKMICHFQGHNSQWKVNNSTEDLGNFVDLIFPVKQKCQCFPDFEGD